MKFNYEWYLKDGYPEKNGYKVFSCFACGGGSTMGYKLAGFDVIGMNEIDPKLAECYIENHKPKYPFIEDLRDFNKRNDLPKELYNLDILDGSPPCSTFSMAGSREKAWGVEKKFREGQSKQTLDDLLFVFIETCKKLQPKICLLENVKGLTFGSAKKYCEEIYLKFDTAGYYVNHWVLDASKMGVPQKRERVFFIAIRKDLSNNIPFVDIFRTQPDLDLVFNEKEIMFENIIDMNGRNLSENMKKVWEYRQFGDSSMELGCFRLHNRKSYFSQSFLYKNKVPSTITSHEDSLVLYDVPKYTSKKEVSMIGSYPLDYQFKKNKPHYIIGMSVPPVMIAQIATRIKEQWLKEMK
jgi:DNA (cytosine-5)-methyltransferase 1